LEFVLAEKRVRFAMAANGAGSVQRFSHWAWRHSEGEGGKRLYAPTKIVSSGQDRRIGAACYG
jgi:hypothetical protein